MWKKAEMIWALSWENLFWGISNKASFKPVSSATENSWKIEISPVASLHVTLQKAYNKGTDQTVRMRMLVCACVVRKPLKTGFLVAAHMWKGVQMKEISV